MKVKSPIDEHVLYKTMGLERIDLLDEAAGRAVLVYRAGAHQCHSGTIVQGGFVTGWIDSAMAHAVLAATHFATTPLSLEIKVSFFQSTEPGLVTATGWVVKRGRSTAFLEGDLRNEAGEVLARASSTMRLLPRKQT